MINFKNIRFVAVFALLLAFASLGYGQTAMTSTTNTPALTATTRSFVVGSATGITGPALAQAKGGVGGSTASNLTVLVIDREAMDVLAVSSTTVTVKRGTRGTAAVPHVASSKVWVGPASSFTDADPSGSCTRTVLSYVPLINIKTGIAWDCMGGQWGNFVNQPQVGTAIASQAGAMAGAFAIIAKVTHITGTAAITGFTVPPGLPDGGTFITVPDGAFTWTAAGNIVSTGTAVAGKAIVWTYDRTAAKLYPSY